MNPIIANARSFLFVPGDRPERLPKALASAAHAVIVDLEDAVAVADKPLARRCAAEAIGALTAADRARVLVRISAVGAEWQEADVRLLMQLTPARIGGVVLAKAEEAHTIERIARAVTLPVVPLVESAQGLYALDMVAKARGVARLAFGHLDFQLDLGMQCGHDERELDSVRLALVMASRRAGLAAPIDGVTTALDDDARLQADAQRSHRLGFGAKLCIHPKQAAIVNAAFAPSEGQLDWARRVVDAARQAKGGAFRLDGQMVDAPVLARAQALLEAA
jgi:citrate lyase subunit beta/citryl-CoA lyase